MKMDIQSYRYSENTKCQTCAFEYIYFARPDSIIDGLDVHTTRVKAGEQLFKEHPLEADLSYCSSRFRNTSSYRICKGIRNTL